MRLANAWTHSLTREFNHAERADRSHGGFRAVLLQMFGDAHFNIASVTRHAHVDEIAHNQSAQIAQTKLAANFFNRFLVGVVGVGLAVARGTTLAAVDVNGNKRFSLIKHKRAARRQRNFTAMNAVDLSVQIKRREDGRGSIIKQHFWRVFCENHFKERGHALPRGLVVNNNVADGFIHHFTNGAQQNIAFGVQLRGRANRVDALGHGLPQALQVRGVAL